MLDHTDRFGSKKLFHIQREVSGCVVTQQQPAVVSGTTRFYHGASARPDVPSFLNNSECSMWCIQE